MLEINPSLCAVVGFFIPSFIVLLFCECDPFYNFKKGKNLFYFVGFLGENWKMNSCVTSKFTDKENYVLYIFVNHTEIAHCSFDFVGSLQTELHNALCFFMIIRWWLVGIYCARLLLRKVERGAILWTLRKTAYLRLIDHRWSFLHIKNLCNINLS